MRYWRSLKTILWGTAGLIVSWSFLTLDNSMIKFVFGYALFTLSLLMFILAAFQFYNDNRKIARSKPKH